MTADWRLGSAAQPRNDGWLEAGEVLRQRLDLLVAHPIDGRRHLPVVVGAHVIPVVLQLLDHVCILLPGHARHLLRALEAGRVAGVAFGFLDDFLSLRHQGRIGLEVVAAGALRPVEVGEIAHILVGQDADHRRHHGILASPFLEVFELTIQVLRGLPREHGVLSRARVAVGPVAVRARGGQLRALHCVRERGHWQDRDDDREGQ
jgi:hypothetical protein